MRRVVVDRAAVRVAVLMAALTWSAGCSTGPSSQPAAGRGTPQTPAPAVTSRPDPTATTSVSRSPCDNPEGGLCLGQLAAGGAYQTEKFVPQLRYDVPPGWANYEDTPGNFLLVPPKGDLPGVNAGTSDYIGVYTSIAAPDGCDPGPAPGVQTTPEAIAAWVKRNKGLTATSPRKVNIGGLKGLVLDVRMEAGWKKTCPNYGPNTPPLVPLITGMPPSGLDHNVFGRVVVRLYLLAYRGHTLAIEVDDVTGGEHLTQHSRVVDNFQFQT